MAVHVLATQLRGCKLVSLWPGQDGYDYAFQGDYRAERRYLPDAVTRVAKAHPDLRFSLRYKPKEPRTHSYMARAADPLLIAREVGLPNVGVTIDTGRPLVAGENIAEAAVLQDSGGRLFHMHFNDSHRAWDDAMIVGSVHFTELVELMFWLKETGYAGWYSMDQYPYRADGEGALRASIEFCRASTVSSPPATRGELRGIIARGNPVESTGWIRERLFRK